MFEGTKLTWNWRGVTFAVINAFRNPNTPSYTKFKCICPQKRVSSYEGVNLDPSRVKMEKTVEMVA